VPGLAHRAYNHGYLLQRLREEVDRAEGNCSPVSFIMLDIDHFKEYNDTYGHVMETSVAPGRPSHSSTLEANGYGRAMGGEEFGIVLPNTTPEQASLVANRIRDTWSPYRSWTGRGIQYPSPPSARGLPLSR